MMEIQFTRHTQKKHTITCTRRDGSKTWMQIDDFFVYHDLMHYAVETTLDYRQAFYGMLAAGTNITDFELPKEQRPFEITGEALHSECIVNLALVEFTQGKVENFNQALIETYASNGHQLPVPVLPHETIEQLHAAFGALVLQWKALAADDSLTLYFKE